MAELLGHAGFEWLMIETEHHGLELSGVQHMLRAIGNTPLADGEALNVPQGVTVMIDGGALIKLIASNVDVGSNPSANDLL